MFEKGQRAYILFSQPVFETITKLAKRDNESLSFKVGSLIREALLLEGDVPLPTPEEIEKREKKKELYNKKFRI